MGAGRAPEGIAPLIGGRVPDAEACGRWDVSIEPQKAEGNVAEVSRKKNNERSGLAGLRGAFQRQWTKNEELPAKLRRQFEAFQALTIHDLRSECLSCGIAPPPRAARADLLACLRTALAWQAMSRAELLRACRRRGLSALRGEPPAELLQRLKESTWEARGIPLRSFASKAALAAGVLEHFEKLEGLSGPELVWLSHRKGLPIESHPDREALLGRLRQLSVWEHMPTAQLQKECCRRGLTSSEDEACRLQHRGMFSFRRLLASDRMQREELLRKLLQEMHEDFQQTEHQPSDELVSQAPKVCEETWLCCECNQWVCPIGEPALVDGQRCCDDCALRIWAAESQKAEELEEAEVLEWLCKWRRCRDTVTEPAPEPTLIASESPQGLQEPEEEEKGEDDNYKYTVQSEVEPEEEEALQRLENFEEERASTSQAAWAPLPDCCEAVHATPPLDRRDPAAAIPFKVPTSPAPTFAPTPTLGHLRHSHAVKTWAGTVQPTPQDDTTPTTQSPTTDDEVDDIAAWGELDDDLQSQSALVQEGRRPALCVRFLYASPLFVRSPLRALNVRADWEALSAAEGVKVKVCVATADSLREALVARSPEILHLSAHCTVTASPNADRGEAASIMLERASGGVHCMAASEFADMGWWGGVELLVLLACSSQAFAQRLIHAHGLRRAVCCSTVIRDNVVHLFCRTFYRALGAGQALLSSFEAAKASIRCSPDERLRGEAGKFVLLGEKSDLWTPALAVSPFASWARWPQWPQVEDFLGRETMVLNLAMLFEKRRAVCLWGSEGAGKTALCAEFCRHFSAPGGRRFSAGAYIVDYAHVSAEATREGMERALLLALLAELQQSRFCPCAVLSNIWPSMKVPGQQRLLRKVAQQLDKAGPWLLVVDGLSACQLPAVLAEGGRSCHEPPLSVEHALLADLLQATANLHILLTARSPLRGQWASLGPSKVIETRLPELAQEDTARLLALRAGRPFYRCDFDKVYSCESIQRTPLPLNQELIKLLTVSPITELLSGHPGRIIRAAAEVHLELPSLLQHPWLQRKASWEKEVESSSRGDTAELPGSAGTMQRLPASRTLLKTVFKPVAMESPAPEPCPLGMPGRIAAAV
eukprot:TRINITY_DN19257_c0_g1_i1.p1 TRINITY_DN19257_c0_g1~~TRINITY_DN19257_c0_g1_i1.p1  ORF type:complete len:1234 (+),score=279.60 TRINITY_DN19257_c0_g1_i1:377-3703(+)